MSPFDLAGIRVRGTARVFFVDELNLPTKLFDYDPTRLLVQFWQETGTGLPFVVGRSFGEVTPMVQNNCGYYVPLDVYGPQEIWFAGVAGGQLQPTAGYYQALYRDEQ